MGRHDNENAPSMDQRPAEGLWINGSGSIYQRIGAKQLFGEPINRHHIAMKLTLLDSVALSSSGAID